MSKEKWNDRKIEELLKQSPDIHDLRSKEMVFEKLRAEGVFNKVESTPQIPAPKVNPKKKVNIPRIASVVAIFVIVLVVPLLILSKQGFQIQDLAGQQEKSADSTTMDMQDDAAFEAESADRASSIGIMQDKDDLRTALYEDEVHGESVFTLGLSGDAAESVPISFKIPQSYIEELFGANTPTYLQLYEAIAPKINEVGLGFNEYHPLSGRFEEEGTTLIHYLPEDHMYDIGSAALSNYIGVLSDTFGDHYDQVMLYAEDGSPLELSDIGLIEEPIALKGTQMKSVFFIFNASDGKSYLSSNFREQFNSVDEAFQRLSENTNDIYETAMLADLPYQLQIDKSVVTLRFENPLDLTTLAESDAMRMLEAVVLTANSFGLQMQFENIVQSQWCGFDFTKVIPKVVGLNEMDYSEVILK